MPDFLQHPVDHRSVLANVEAHGAETKNFRFPTHGPHQRGCNAHRFHVNKGALSGGKFGDEFTDVAERALRPAFPSGEAAGR